MCMCMCMCMYVCIHTFIHIGTHKFIHAYTPIYIHICSDILIPIYSYTCAYGYKFMTYICHIHRPTHIHMCIHIYIFIPICMHTYKHIYAFIYTFTHNTHTHTTETIFPAHPVARPCSSLIHLSLNNYPMNTQDPDPDLVIVSVVNSPQCHVDWALYMCQAPCGTLWPQKQITQDHWAPGHMSTINGSLS